MTCGPWESRRQRRSLRIGAERGTFKTFGGDPALEQLTDRRRSRRHAHLEPESVQDFELILAQHDLESLAARRLIGHSPVSLRSVLMSIYTHRLVGGVTAHNTRRLAKRA